MLTGVGQVTVRPAGATTLFKFTGPANPLILLIVTVAVPVFVVGKPTVAGASAILKSPTWTYSVPRWEIVGAVGESVTLAVITYSPGVFDLKVHVELEIPPATRGAKAEQENVRPVAG